jgi:GTP-binding protein EngB required for normal cell division
MDRLLVDIEDALNPARSHSVFPKYVQDIAPVQRKTIEDYLARIRAQLLRVLAGQLIEVEKPRITASHSIHIALTFVEIAIEELSPSRMSGYGPVSESGSADLNGVMQELQSIVQQLHGYVLQRDVPDIHDRLNKLDDQVSEIEILRRIEEIVTRRGLVEFRSTMLMLLDRLEDTAFEIAIFGRVSSGKSSLLNHVIGADILPIGVTPITAVPTRVSYACEPKVEVWIEGAGPQDIDISRLSEFVDERLNHGNEKRVAKLTVGFPSDSLREGIVLVDTPGLGSLATSGAAETMAYLPRCDVGVVLVDAASTLTPDDLKILQALSNAAIPVMLALSKADLLSDADRQHVQRYVHDHLLAELAMNVAVYPVSVMPAHKFLLDGWLREGLISFYDRYQELRRQSIQRKILALRTSVRGVLEASFYSVAETVEHQAALLEIDSQLRRSSGVLQSITPELLKIAEQASKIGPEILRKAADTAVLGWESEPRLDLGDVLWTTATKMVAEVAGLLHTTLEQTARSLVHELLKASGTLRFPDSPSAIEITIEREMPVFHMNRERLSVSKPLLASIFGRSTLRRYALGELRVLRPALERALDSYARLLRGWSERALSAVEQQFTVYADRYRAQLDRQLMGPAGASESDVNRLVSDLESLSESSVGAMPELGVRKQAS